MLEVIGVKSVDELIAQTMPADILLEEPLDLDEPLTEQEHQYASCDSTQYIGESRMVHLLHSIPSRSEPRSFGGIVCISNDD